MDEKTRHLTVGGGNSSNIVEGHPLTLPRRWVTVGPGGDYATLTECMDAEAVGAAAGQYILTIEAPPDPALDVFPPWTTSDAKEIILAKADA